MRSLTVLSLVIFTTFLFSQEMTQPISKPEGEKKMKTGWQPRLGIAAGYLLNNNKNVVGQKEGSITTIAASINGALSYKHNGHEWRNILDINEAFTKTPDIDKFIKSTDYLKVDSIYLYHIHKRWGPYASANLVTTIFKSREVTSVSNVYQKSDAGATETTDDLALADPFTPLTLNESIGLFYTPYESPLITAEVRAGGAAMQVFADGGYALNDDDATADVIEVQELENFTQLGAAGALYLTGTFKHRAEFKYDFSAVMMIPLVNDDNAERDAMELANYDINFLLTAQVEKWLSLNYVFKALKQPQLVDEWQVQNSFMISVSYMLIGEEEKK